jgi:hypothetical protein
MGVDLVSSIRDIQRRIASMKREIVSLETQLREARVLLNDEAEEGHGSVVLRTRPIRPRSSVWWAQSVLRHAGQPVHIDELVQRIEEFSGHSVRKSTLVGNLSRYVRAHDTFSRIEEGVYALLDVPAREHNEDVKEGRVSV